MDQFSYDPGAYASFDDPASERGRSRDSMLLSAQLRLPVTAPPATVRVRNLSPGGLMAEYAGEVAIGDPAAIEVRGIGWINGSVAWIAEGRIGIAFDEAVDPKLARKPVAVKVKPPVAPKAGRPIV